VKAARTHCAPNRAGLTLVEVMVAVSVGMIIVFVTFVIFNKTQKVWRAGRDSTHVLETGRAVMDMVADDLSRLSMDPYQTQGMHFRSFNYRAYPVHTNLFTFRQHRSEVTKFVNSRVVFTTHHKDRGFEVNEYRLYSSTNAAAYNTNVVGTLYKYTYPLGTNWILPSQLFSRPGFGAGFQKVADGVVHLQVRAVSPRHLDPGRALMENPRFTGPVLPTHLELELGILEDKLTREISGREPDFNHQLTNITKHLDRVHLFRQLIPIRNPRP